MREDVVSAWLGTGHGNDQPVLSSRCFDSSAHCSGRRGRGGCLVHSGDNHWLVMKRRWSLKMLKAIAHCSDHCTSSSNHVVECVRRVIAHGGRQAKHSQPWRFARRRFVGHIFASGEKCVEIGSCGGAYTHTHRVESNQRSSSRALLFLAAICYQ